MINSFLKIAYSGIVVSLCILSFAVPLAIPTVYAAESAGYTPLVPIDGLTSTNCNTSQSVAQQIADPNCKANLGGFIPGLVKLAIQIAGALAVIMIVIGGVQYASTDAIGGKSEGKARIENAIYGLLLAIAAFFILNTINPKTLSLDLEMRSPSVPGPVTPVPSTPTTPGTTPADVCNNCVTLGVGKYTKINYKSGNMLNVVKADNALKLTEKLQTIPIAWRITEAYPPTIVHQSACHGDGMCFDANIMPGVVNVARPTATEISRLNSFFKFAIESGYALVQFEVAKQSESDALFAAGLNSNYKIYVNPAFSAPHFHIR